MADELDSHRAIETGLRGQVDLAHPSRGQLALEAKIAAQNHAFVFRRRRLADGPGRLLGDLQGINAGIRSDGLSLEEIASRQVTEGHAEPVAQLRRQFAQRFPMRIAGDAQ